MDKNSFRKFSWIEGAIIAFPSGWFLVTTIRNSFFDPEVVIDVVFIMLLVTLLIFKNGSLRHMRFAYILLSLAVAGSLLKSERFAYTAASLALGLFVLGIINMILFRRRQ